MTNYTRTQGHHCDLPILDFVPATHSMHCPTLCTVPTVPSCLCMFHVCTNVIQISHAEWVARIKKDSGGFEGIEGYHRTTEASCRRKMCYTTGTLYCACCECVGLQMCVKECISVWLCKCGPLNEWICVVVTMYKCANLSVLLPVHVCEGVSVRVYKCGWVCMTLCIYFAGNSCRRVTCIDVIV